MASKIAMLYGPVPKHIRTARLEEAISRITDPPVLSAVGMRLINELNQQDSSIKTLTEIIQSEPGLAAKVLRYANSSYCGIRHQIQTIRHAISMIGLDNIKEIAFNLYFYSFSKSFTRQQSEQVERYLNRSLTTAVLTRKICHHYEFASTCPGESYLAGLLSNIGVLLLYQVDKERYQLTLEIRQEKQITAIEAEEQVFGFNHCDIGHWLAKQWNLPHAIQEVVRYHHAIPKDAVLIELLTAVQLAEWVCDKMGVTLDNQEIVSGASLGPMAVRILMAHSPGRSLEVIQQRALTVFGSICLATGELTRVLNDTPKTEQKEETPQIKKSPMAAAPVISAEPEPPQMTGPFLQRIFLGPVNALRRLFSLL